MLKIPNDDGVDLYDVEYAKELVRLKLGGNTQLMFMPLERINALVDDLYARGYMVAQAHDEDSIRTLMAAFSTNQSIAVEKKDLFGTLKLLKPSDALALMMNEADKSGLPSAFLAPQFQKLVGELYGNGILVAQCDEEPQRRWFAEFHRRNPVNPSIRLKAPQKEGGG